MSGEMKCDYLYFADKMRFLVSLQKIEISNFETAIKPEVCSYYLVLIADNELKSDAKLTKTKL